MKKEEMEMIIEFVENRMKHLSNGQREEVRSIAKQEASNKVLDVINTFTNNKK